MSVNLFVAQLRFEVLAGGEVEAGIVLPSSRFTDLGMLNVTGGGTFATGNGGSVTIHTGSLAVKKGGQIAVTSIQSTADAGEIFINAKLVYLFHGLLNASAGHNGGNITVDPDFAVLNNGGIFANADAGNGGSLLIKSQYLFASPGTATDSITADSQHGNQGEVVIDATQIDLSGVLLGLPSSLADVGSQLRPYCGIRLAGGVSSFLVVGNGGVPIDPFGTIPDFNLGTTNDQK